MSDVDPGVLGIIDESEPDPPEKADADYSREGADPSTVSDQTAADAEGEATRSADGSTDQTDSVEAPSDEPAQADTQSGEDGEAVGSKYQFGGREWDNQEAAEQAFRSWDGRISASEDKVKDYEKRLSDYYEYVESASKENDNLRSQLTGETAPDGIAAPTEEAAPTSVDVERLVRIVRMAEDRGVDPMEAFAKLYDEESRTLLDTRFSEMEKRISAPLEQMTADTEEATREREVFNWAQSEKLEDGTFKYPELQVKDGALDTDFIGNVYEAWQTLGQKFGAEYAYSSTGIDYAYRLASDYAAKQAPAAAGAPTAAVTPDRSSNSAAEAASDLTGATPKSPGRPKQTATKAALQELADLRPVSFDGGDELGFYS